MTKDLPWHVEIGRELAELRRRGVLILGSGNVVHNLRTMLYGREPYDWASEFDAGFACNLEARNLAALSDREELGALLKLAHPTVEHYLPALTVAVAGNHRDELLFMNESIDIASISMRSFVLY